MSHKQLESEKVRKKSAFREEYQDCVRVVHTNGLLFVVWIGWPLYASCRPKLNISYIYVYRIRSPYPHMCVFDFDLFFLFLLLFWNRKCVPSITHLSPDHLTGCSIDCAARWHKFHSGRVFHRRRALFFFFFFFLVSYRLFCLSYIILFSSTSSIFFFCYRCSVLTTSPLT